MKINETAIRHLCGHGKRKNKRAMSAQLKIGIVGGGKRCRSLLQHAVSSGWKLSLMDDLSCRSELPEGVRFVAGNVRDDQDLLRFGKDFDLIAVWTAEANVDALRSLSNMGIVITPGIGTIETLQNRLLRNLLLNDHNIPMLSLADSAAPYEVQEQRISEKQHLAGPLPLQEVLTSRPSGPYPDLQAGKLHVIVSRSLSGNVTCFHPALMTDNGSQIQFDLRTCPAYLNPETAVNACTLAARLARAISLSGMLSVEMYLSHNERLFVGKISTVPGGKGLPAVAYAKDQETVLALRSTLGLPTSTGNRTTLLPGILEPAAFRKKAISDALRLILCADDFPAFDRGYSYSPYRERLLGTGPSVDDPYELLAKSIVVCELLAAPHCAKHPDLKN